MKQMFLVTIGSSLLTAPYVFAADQPHSLAPTQQDADTANTITVIARAISESEQSLPFTTNHMDHKALESRQIKDGQSLLWQTPGVALNNDGQNPESSIKIRGVGSINQVSSDDTSVVVYQNGSPVPSENITRSLLDISQVDILKGPQGTLFGRNSEAGAINITPNKPTPKWEGHIGGRLGTRHNALGEAVINAPLSHQLSSRIALQYDQKDLPVKNPQDNNKALTKPYNITGRESLLWQPSDNDDLLFTIDHQAQRHNAAPFSLLDKSNETSLPKGSSNVREDSKTFSLKWQHYWDNFQLTNVTSWEDYKHQTLAPSYDDKVNQRIYGQRYDSMRQFTNHQKQLFEEVRLGSNEDSKIFWVTGLNYLHSGRNHRYNGIKNDNPGWASDPLNARINRHYSTDSAALFGETTVPLTDKLALTTGLRHTWEHLDYNVDWKANPSYQGDGARSHTNDQAIISRYFTGRIGLDYKLTDNWNVYTIYSRGHKPKGFNDWDTSIASGEATSPYKAANVDSYEVGTKTSIAPLHIELNQAVFYNKTHNDHFAVITDPSQSWATTTENFNTESKGVEFSATWKPARDFAMQAGIDYTDATVTSLPADSMSGGKKGHRIPDVPRWGATLSTDYARPMHIADHPVTFKGNLSYRYSGQREADVGNNFKLGKTHLVNAKAGVESQFGDLYLWSTNLLNNRSAVYGYYLSAISPSEGGTGKDARAGTVREGRAVGIEYQYHF